MTYEDLSEPDRYDTAEGYEPPSKYQKLLDDYRKKHPEEFCRESMLETRPANECMQTGAANKPPAQLFGDLWREGEMAVLVGESGVGKSIFAVQIAESIARGRPALVENGKLKPESRKPTGSRQLSTFHSPLSTNFPLSTFRFPLAPAQPVLYLDLEHSDAQFAARYSCPSPIPGKLPVKYRFSPKLSRTAYGDLYIPEAFNGDLARYFRHSLNLMLEFEPAKVIVIDNLSYLDPKASGTAAAARRMRSLKLLAVTTGVPILVLDSSPPCSGGVAASRGRGGSSELRIPPSALRIYEPADSVFAIGRSTFAPEMRYIKHLKANYVRMDNGQLKMENSSDQSLSTVHCQLSTEVSVYQLDRMENSWSKEKGKYKTENPQLLPASGNSPLSTVNFPLAPAAPFLGFEYLGVAAESDLIRDYEREQREAEAREQSRLKKLRRSSREILVDGILDGSYGRYLQGE